MLVIYLLFETTKLSREKIRHQFALDTSAFTELTAASNFLNNIAYSNGAYPFRIFREYYEIDKEEIDPDPDAMENPPSKQISLYEFYYVGGAFPQAVLSDIENGVIPPEATEWEFHYFASDDPVIPTPPQASWETETPSADPETYYPINSEFLALAYKVPFDTDAIALYVLMYNMLGKIYEGQRKVYDTVSNGGEFFRKAYYLNACSQGGEGCSLSQAGREGSKEFKKYIVGTTPLYINKIALTLKNTHDHNTMPMKWDLNDKDLDLIGGKLYQFAYLNPGSRERLRQLFNGIDINQPFAAPSNYFGINLARYKPHTHVRVAMQCTKASNNCLWPNPTPKYQVRTNP
jgi:hypothetical protein